MVGTPHIQTARNTGGVRSVMKIVDILIWAAVISLWAYGLEPNRLTDILLFVVIIMCRRDLFKKTKDYC